MDNQAPLIFRDDWKPIYNPVTVENEPKAEDESVPEKKKKENVGKPLLLIIQILICVIALLSVFAVKNFNPSWYNSFFEWYDKNLNNEIILSETFENYTLDSLINAFKTK